MAGIIVGNAIVKGEATSGVTIAEIIGMINKYGLSLGCEPPEYISKLYQNNSASIELVGFDPSSYDEYAGCLLYTSDAADERSSVDLGGRRIIKNKNRHATDATKM